MKDPTSKTEVLVVASSYPSVSQPWIESHLRQLDQAGIDFRILSFSSPPIDDSQPSLSRFLNKATFLSWETIDVVRSAIMGVVRNPLPAIPAFIAALRTSQGIAMGVKSRLRIALFTLHLRNSIGPVPNARVLHVHFDQDAALLIPWALAGSVPLISTYHGLNPYGVSRNDLGYREVAYRHSAAILANTGFAGDQATQLGCPERKVRIIPQPIHLEDFPFRPLPPPEPGQPLRILTVGRLQRDKGQAYAVLAAARMHQARIPFVWTFVGTGPDRDRLLHLVSRFGLGDTISFVDRMTQSDLKDEYHRSHVLVLPSVSNKHGHLIETQGVVLQEAQASGCLVVSTRVGGIPDCVSDDIDGILVAERDSSAIFSALRRLYSSTDNWERIRQNGRTRVIEQFDATIVGDKIRRLYQLLVGSPQSRSA
ncbi:MAG: glycosyltransferase [Gemmatimonadaceae bacterium]|nr:glycosyltransferase [Gemmatimonadaceae bacterium]